ncbi:hypothetical protein DW083_20225 [Parabacteroides sp. AF48-14]|uniref:hypothetical protein n=1 Tax=Parabacteroides sp. AF48-14 TaxID=2292052 RepID=UPI000F01043C|nr:hypothetical protein [Parabacteroides sp. AF48-14]RHO65703.1 hypothetical protein DW083_20225 [Parabacteroides sp. AF48-14]
MEHLFNIIQTAIAEGMPGLTLVDEDYGQLQTNEETYPVTFPCVLIGVQGIDWQTITDDYQRGTATIVTKLCIDCYDDTHYTSGTADKVSERIGQFKQLHDIVRLLESDNATPLERTSSRWYSLPGAIKVYESTYECMIDEEPA